MTNPFWLNVRDLDVDALAELGSSTEGIQQKQAVGVAFQRLQTKAMQDAAEAQIGAASDQQRAAEAAIRAAKAAEETAKYTRDSSRWMMWAVIISALTLVLNQLVTWLRH